MDHNEFPEGNASENGSAPRVLAYGVRPSRLRLKRRLVLFLTCAVGTVMTARHWGPAARDRVKLLREQSTWMNYRPPPGQLVAFHDDSTPFGNFRFQGKCSTEARNLMKTSQFT